MGTMLYQKGVFLNTCFDELNLTNPKLVQGIHEEYIRAGADFVETNTFGANEFKLAKFGLAEKVEEILSAGVQIARSAADKTGAFVAGAVGPLGRELAPYGTLSPEEAQTAFARQFRALAEGGADFLILETFLQPAELLLAIETAWQECDLEIIAQLTVNQNQETHYGQSLSEAIRSIAHHPAVTAVGLNCSIGPAIMLSAIETLRAVTNKPISLQPNAGLPREVEGRKIYMCTPEYMAEFAKRFYEKGVKIIGGCCGTTPAHIEQMVRAVRSLEKAAARKPAPLSIAVADREKPKESPEIPLASRSRIGQKLTSGESIFSIEITPPRGIDLAGILAKAKLCVQYGIDAVNIPDGPRASSRISPMITAVKIQQETGLDTILHLCCRDKNLLGLQSDLLGAYAIGLRNMLLITGDPPKLGEYPDATGVFDIDSVGLTSVVHRLNRGIDIGGNAFSPPVGFTIGVGANPVAADLPREIDRFKAKVDAGAEYAITQPVFDSDMLLRFLDAVESHRIPVLAGIWPFTSFKNAEFMANEVPGVVVPPALLGRMSRTVTREEGRNLGIEIAREMIGQIQHRVQGFAVSAPFGNVHIALAVLNKVSIIELPKMQ